MGVNINDQLSFLAPSPVVDKTVDPRDGMTKVAAKSQKAAGKKKLEAQCALCARHKGFMVEAGVIAKCNRDKAEVNKYGMCISKISLHLKSHYAVRKLYLRWQETGEKTKVTESMFISSRTLVLMAKKCLVAGGVREHSHYCGKLWEIIP